MGLFNGIKRIIRPAVDVPRWMDTDTIKRDSRVISDTTRFLFSSSQAFNRESFDEACQRLGLDEATLYQRQRQFLHIALGCLGVALLVFVYSLYLLWHQSLLAAGISFIFTAVCLVQAFHFHFWFFQMKSKKLGCSVKEWFVFGILGRGA